MTKFIIALGLTLAASTAAFAQSTALDAYHVPAFDASASVAAGGTANELIRYNRADNDGSPVFLAPQGGIDYTATASIGGASGDRIVYNRADNDGSPVFLD